MSHNDTLRQIRYIFNLSNKQMIELFQLGELKTSEEDVVAWLKKEEDEKYAEIQDQQLAHFLNGFIVSKRGKKDGPSPIAEKVLNNNIIFRKLKIALALKDIDILELYDSVDLRLSKHELSAFFRNPKQSQYRECQDQFLRNFLYGLKKKHRPEN
ncbi:MAG: hypothetical protein ACI8V8_000474 [Chitinophagales bacterium]|jgi:uncharacterized protein YehS (DUF1456 family)